MFWRKKPTMPQNKKKPSQAESAPKTVGPARSKGTLLSLESRLMFDAAAAATTRTYYCGAWTRYGFHEDGLLSAVNLCQQLLGRDPWSEPKVGRQN